MTGLGELPVIWRSPILNEGVALTQELYAWRRDGTHTGAELRDARIQFRDVSAEHEPAYLTINKKPPDARIGDAFGIIDGHLLITQKFRDLLVQFDLGATRLFELPIYRDKEKTPSGLDPMFMLHVCETKEGFLPEHSIGVTQYTDLRTGEPIPDSEWLLHGFNKGDEVAVSASSAAGADLWGYRDLHYQLFFSDRLKQAIEAEGIRATDLRFFRAMVRP